MPCRSMSIFLSRRVCRKRIQIRFIPERLWKMGHTHGDIEFFSLFNNPFRGLSFEHKSEEHTSELQSLRHLVCRLLLEKKKNTQTSTPSVATLGVSPTATTRNAGT